MADVKVEMLVVLLVLNLEKKLVEHSAEQLVVYLVGEMVVKLVV